MARVLALLVIMLGLLAGGARAQDVRPAGYIMAYELKGADAEKGTVVVRKGVELQPKLLMPVYEGDSVFIRDEESRITLSLAREGNLVVSGKLMRKDIAGEMASGDDSFTIIEQIVAILAGRGDDDSFSVLVSKGAETGETIKVPLAVRGRNYLLSGGEPVRLAWNGGEGPFRVQVGTGKVVIQEARELSIDVEQVAGTKFTVTITDAKKRTVRIPFVVRKALPKVPEKIKARDIGGEIAAVWLAGRDNGAWRVEAVRQLRALPQSETVSGLIAALEKGWLPKDL